MSDEQMIYLDPDDDLNRVTERLEAATRQRVILIVPLQTQMRSNVFWRLLYSRARGLGRDVTVVSADRQVRSVAKSAGFRIDDVPDSSKSSKGRSGSPGRTIRSQLEGRIAHPSRSQFARPVPRKSGTLSRNQPAAPLDSAQERTSQQPWREPESAHSPIGEKSTGQAQDNPPLRIEDDEFERPFEFRIDSSQAMPLSPSSQRREEEQDPYIPDYEKSRGILQSWQNSQAAPPAQMSPTQFEPTSSAPGPSTLPRSSQFDRDSAPPDPFDVFDERLPAPLPEQRGSAFVQEIDDGIPDIAEKPVEIGSEPEIEFLGEDEATGGSTVSPVEPQRQWPTILDDEPEEYEPRRVYGSRPRSSRSGTLSRRPLRDFYDDEDLAPVDERPTGAPILPPQPYAPPPAPQQPPPRQAAPRASSGAIAQPLRPQRNVTMPPVVPPGVAAASRTGASPAARPAPQQATRPQPSRRGSRALAVVLIALLLLVLGGVGLFYYGTSATVTLTLPAKSLSKSKLTLFASTNPQDKAHNTVASQVLSYTASATGTAPATGMTPQGSSRASGIATFTNNGSVQVEIPTNTVISTPAGAGTSGVGFVTTADALIQPGSQYQIPIQAQSAGVSGNVGAGKITVIPAESLTAIAMANNIPTTSLNLSVTNPSATTGGGVKNVPAATQNDIAALKLKLHQQIQAQIKAWLQTQLLGGGQHGTPIPDVLGSANPLSQEILTQAPAVGQALSSSTIKGTLTVEIKVLIVRASDILAAAQQQLNRAALPQYTITTAKGPVHISKIAAIGSKGGTLLTITLNATGQIVPYVDSAQLSNFLAGKTEDQAKSDIQSYSQSGIRNVQNIDIMISPGFLHILPFRPEHILISVVPGNGPT